MRLNCRLFLSLFGVAALRSAASSMMPYHRVAPSPGRRGTERMSIQRSVPSGRQIRASIWNGFRVRADSAMAASMRGRSSGWARA